MSDTITPKVIKAQQYIAVMLQVPVTSIADKTETKKGFKLLGEQVIAYAEAIKKDPNVILLDSLFICKPEDYANDVADRPVNVAIAEHMATKTLTAPLKKIITASTPVVIPEVPSTPVVATKITPVVKAAEPIADTDDESAKIIDKIFVDLKKTEKSLTVVTVFAKNPGKELTYEELMNATKFKQTDLASWLGMTAKKSIPAIVNVRRGIYKLDLDILFKS